MPTVTFETDLGWIAFHATPLGVAALTFGHEDAAAATQALRSLCDDSEEPADWVFDARRLLEEFAAGAAVDLNQIPLDLPSATAFQSRVREAVRQLQYGQTASYGEIAARVGAPGAARAVGTVMSTNPLPLLIPCHRVLGGGGRLGGYSAPQGLAMKRQLLDMEQGVASLVGSR